MESSAAETKAAGNWTDVANALRWRRAGVDACNAMKDRGNKETTAEKKKGVASGRCDSLTHIDGPVCALNTERGAKQAQQKVNACDSQSTRSPC